MGVTTLLSGMMGRRGPGAGRAADAITPVVGAGRGTASHFILWGFASLAMVSAGLSFDGFAPDTLLFGWRVVVGVYLLVWLALNIRLLSSPRPSELQRFIGDYVTIGMCLNVLSVLWVLLPFGDVALQLGTIIFSVIYVVTAQIATSGQLSRGRAVILATTASMAAVTVIYSVPLWPYLAPFLLVFGVAMIALSNQVALSIAEMRLARLQAERDRDARTRFLAAASHDLGQPLRAARLLLRQSQQHPDPAARSKAAETAGEALASMQRLVESMLTHLRLQSEVTVPRWRPVPVAEAIGRIASQFEAAAHLQGVSLRAVPSTVVITSDGDLLERALGNLVENALKHARAKRILFGAKRRGRALRLVVVDDGCGVPEDDRPYLFEEFRQGCAAGDGERGGFGLGLASVRQMAALLHGRAGLDERWRSGSAFFIEVPLGDGHIRA